MFVFLLWKYLFNFFLFLYLHDPVMNLTEEDKKVLSLATRPYVCYRAYQERLGVMAGGASINRNSGGCCNVESSSYGEVWEFTWSIEQAVNMSVIPQGHLLTEKAMLSMIGASLREHGCFNVDDTKAESGIAMCMIIHLSSQGNKKGASNGSRRNPRNDRSTTRITLYIPHHVLLHGIQYVAVKEYLPTTNSIKIYKNLPLEQILTEQVTLTLNGLQPNYYPSVFDDNIAMDFPVHVIQEHNFFLNKVWQDTFLQSELLTRIRDEVSKIKTLQNSKGLSYIFYEVAHNVFQMKDEADNQKRNDTFSRRLDKALMNTTFDEVLQAVKDMNNDPNFTDKEKEQLFSPQWTTFNTFKSDMVTMNGLREIEEKYLSDLPLPIHSIKRKNKGKPQHNGVSSSGSSKCVVSTGRGNTPITQFFERSYAFISEWSLQKDMIDNIKSQAMLPGQVQNTINYTCKQIVNRLINLTYPSIQNMYLAVTSTMDDLKDIAREAAAFFQDVGQDINGYWIKEKIGKYAINQLQGYTELQGAVLRIAQEMDQNYIDAFSEIDNYCMIEDGRLQQEVANSQKVHTRKGRKSNYCNGIDQHLKDMAKNLSMIRKFKSAAWSLWKYGTQANLISIKEYHETIVRQYNSERANIISKFIFINQDTIGKIFQEVLIDLIPSLITWGYIRSYRDVIKDMAYQPQIGEDIYRDRKCTLNDVINKVEQLIHFNGQHTHRHPSKHISVNKPYKEVIVGEIERELTAYKTHWDFMEGNGGYSGYIGELVELAKYLDVYDIPGTAAAHTRHWFPPNFISVFNTSSTALILDEKEDLNKWVENSTLFDFGTDGHGNFSTQKYPPPTGLKIPEFKVSVVYNFGNLNRITKQNVIHTYHLGENGEDYVMPIMHNLKKLADQQNNDNKIITKQLESHDSFMLEIMKETLPYETRMLFNMCTKTDLLNKPRVQSNTGTTYSLNQDLTYENFFTIIVDRFKKHANNKLTSGIRRPWIARQNYSWITGAINYLIDAYDTYKPSDVKQQHKLGIEYSMLSLFTGPLNIIMTDFSGEELRFFDEAVIDGSPIFKIDPLKDIQHHPKASQQKQTDQEREIELQRFAETIWATVIEKDIKPNLSAAINHILGTIVTNNVINAHRYNLDAGQGYVNETFTFKCPDPTSSNGGEVDVHLTAAEINTKATGPMMKALQFIRSKYAMNSRQQYEWQQYIHEWFATGGGKWLLTKKGGNDTTDIVERKGYLSPYDTTKTNETEYYLLNILALLMGTTVPLRLFLDGYTCAEVIDNNSSSPLLQSTRKWMAISRSAKENINYTVSFLKYLIRKGYLTIYAEEVGIFQIEYMKFNNQKGIPSSISSHGYLYERIDPDDLIMTQSIQPHMNQFPQKIDYLFDFLDSLNDPPVETLFTDFSHNYTQTGHFEHLMQTIKRYIKDFALSVRTISVHNFVLLYSGNFHTQTWTNLTRLKRQFAHKLLPNTALTYLIYPSPTLESLRGNSGNSNRSMEFYLQKVKQTPYIEFKLQQKFMQNDVHNINTLVNQLQCLPNGNTNVTKASLILQAKNTQITNANNNNLASVQTAIATNGISAGVACSSGGGGYGVASVAQQMISNQSPTRPPPHGANSITTGIVSLQPVASTSISATVLPGKHHSYPQVQNTTQVIGNNPTTPLHMGTHISGASIPSQQLQNSCNVSAPSSTINTTKQSLSTPIPLNHTPVPVAKIGAASLHHYKQQSLYPAATALARGPHAFTQITFIDDKDFANLPPVKPAGVISTSLPMSRANRAPNTNIGVATASPRGITSSKKKTSSLVEENKKDTSFTSAEIDYIATEIVARQHAEKDIKDVKAKFQSEQEEREIHKEAMKRPSKRDVLWRLFNKGDVHFVGSDKDNYVSGVNTVKIKTTNIGALVIRNEAIKKLLSYK